MKAIAASQNSFTAATATADHRLKPRSMLAQMTRLPVTACAVWNRLTEATW